MQFRFCYCCESKKESFIIAGVFHNVAFEEARFSYEGLFHCGQCLQTSTLHTSKNSPVKCMRIECTLNSYLDQFAFSPLLLPLILTWLCLCVWRKAPSARKEVGLRPVGGFAAKRYCTLLPFACWCTVMERSNWPWKCTRPHSHLILLLRFCFFHCWKLQRSGLVNQVSWTIKNIPKGSKCANVDIISSADVYVFASLTSLWLHCAALWYVSTSNALEVRLQLKKHIFGSVFHVPLFPTCSM